MHFVAELLQGWGKDWMQLGVISSSNGKMGYGYVQVNIYQLTVCTLVTGTYHILLQIKLYDI